MGVLEGAGARVWGAEGVRRVFLRWSGNGGAGNWLQHCVGVQGAGWGRALGCWEGMQSSFGVLQGDVEPGFEVLEGHTAGVLVAEGYGAQLWGARGAQSTAGGAGRALEQGQEAWSRVLGR